MGLGDVKLAAVMGLFLGRNVAPGDLRRPARRVGRRPGDDRPPRRRARKQAIPFGPFLALGGVVGLLAGDELVDWYLGTYLLGSSRFFLIIE